MTAQMTPDEVQDFLLEKFADLFQTVPKFSPAPPVKAEYEFDPDLDAIADPVFAVKVALEETARRRKQMTEETIEHIRNCFYGIHVLMDDFGEQLERTRMVIHDIRVLLKDMREKS